MSKFKVGDRVRIVSSLKSHKRQFIGTEFTIDKAGYKVNDGEDSWEGPEAPDYVWAESELELVCSPVRTKMETEIVGGDYGKVHVSTYDDTRVRIGVDSIMNATELSCSIDTLTAIRDALQEQSK